MQTARKFWARATKEQRRWALTICEIGHYWLAEVDWDELKPATKAAIEEHYEDFWWKETEG